MHQPMRRIAVLEDDVALRATLLEILALQGYEVTGFSNGRQALHALRSGSPPDLILLDLFMPDMDGWEFRAAQMRDPVLARTPVVVLSACGDDAHLRAIDAEFVIAKPFETHAFLASIEHLFAQLSGERERRRSVAQAERMAALGTLAAGIVHEINNPLASMLLNLHHLRSSAALASSPELCGVVDEVLEGARRIQSIVTDVRAFSRADDVQAIAVDVTRALDASARLVAHQIRPRARLVKEYAETPRVLATEGRLGQLFVNLLVNAAQAIPEEDAGRHTVRVATKTSAAGEAVVEVSGTGAGIAPEVLPRIFEPFFTTKPIGAGTGLGLSICDGIVQSLGGRIEVDSKVGVGSTFRVIVPAAPPLARAIPAVSSAPIAARKRVLLVDDDEALVRSLLRAFARDHDMTVAMSGHRAIELLSADDPYDVVLCEQTLPQMTGIELYEQVRRLRPGLERRIVFMTGATSPPRLSELLRSIPNARLEKPFGIAELAKIISELDALRG